MAINLCYLWRMVLPALFIITARHLNEKLSCKSHLFVVNKKRRRSRWSRQKNRRLVFIISSELSRSLLSFRLRIENSLKARATSKSDEDERFMECQTHTKGLSFDSQMKLICINYVNSMSTRKSAFFPLTLSRI